MQGWEPEQHAREVGVTVVEWDLPGRLQACCDHKRRTVWIARGLNPAQRRSAIAFELGQLQQGPTPSDPCVARAYQRAAEEWAALMLISSEEFVAAWTNCLDLAAMAAGCGVDVATFRARIRAASDADQDAAIEAIAATRMSA